MRLEQDGRDLRIVGEDDESPHDCAMWLAEQALDRRGEARRYFGEDTLLKAAQVYATLATARRPKAVFASGGVLKGEVREHSFYPPGQMPPGW